LLKQQQTHLFIKCAGYDPGLKILFYRLQYGDKIGTKNIFFIYNFLDVKYYTTGLFFKNMQ